MAISRYNSSYKNVGIKEYRNDFTSFTLYPNPSESGSTTYITCDSRIDAIVVTDCLGNIQPIIKGNRNNSFRICNAVPGNYFCSLQTETGRSTERITLK